MHGNLCYKQMCTITVIHYCTEDHQLLIAHCSSHRSTASYSSRIMICAYPTCTYDPVMGPLSKYCHDVWYRKTRMVWLPNGEKFLKICLFILTESTNVTEGQTPHDGIGCTCIASCGKIWPKPTVNAKDATIKTCLSVHATTSFIIPLHALYSRLINF